MVKERVKLLRRILSWTQEQLAEHLKISRVTLVGIERGVSLPNKASLQLLHERLGINPEWFFKTDASLFTDPKKGLSLILGKTNLTRWELLFLCEVMQQVWSRIRCGTRKEFVQKLIFALNYVQSPPPADLEIFIKSPSTTTVAENLAGILAGVLRSKEMTDEQEKTLSVLLLPWSYYVCKAYLTQESQCEPIPSPFLDALQAIVGGKFDYTNQLGGVQVLFRHDRLQVCLTQGRLSIPAEKAFAFLTGVLALKDGFSDFLDKLYLQREHKTLRLLNYEFSNSESEISVTEDEVTLVISYAELQNLVKIVEEMKQNIFFWQYLQNLCVEKFGYV